MSKTERVLIIGAGVIGLCVAEALSRPSNLGEKLAIGEVVVLDPAASSEESASYGNGGIIVPSHFVPLADPGLLRSGLRMMLNPRAPFGLQKFPDLAMIGWILRFMKSATRGRAQAAGPLLRDLNLASRAAYESMIERIGLQVGYSQKGLVMVCRTQKALDDEAHLAESARSLGLGAEVLTGAQVKALEDGVECVGGVHFDDDAHLTPKEFMEGLKRELIGRGVKFEVGRAQRFESQGGKPTSVVTEDGSRHEARSFVVASGAWAEPLVKSIGYRLPMLSGKGYGITTPHADPSGKALSHPLILAEARVAVTPMLDGVRFVGTLELGPPTQTVNSARVDGFLKAVGDYLPGYSNLNRGDVWVGNRPCTPDGLPYLGALPSAPNVVVAAGHAMMGMSLGPVTGDLVAHILLGEKSPIPLDLLSPTRFS